MTIVNRGLVFVNNTDFPIVELRMIPGNETEARSVNFTYECISFKETYMEFKMYWSYFDEVSIKENKDSLKVYFYGP